jgi:hypothetical protein
VRENRKGQLQPKDGEGKVTSMWFTASLLFRNYRLEPEVPNLEAIDVPQGFQQAVQKFLSVRQTRRRHWLWESERLLINFCRYAVAKGAKEIGDCCYEHLLGFLEHRYFHGISQQRLKAEAEILAEFLKFLWQLVGKEGDPLDGENLIEDLEWLDDWFEEILVLVEAESEREAWQKAEAIGERIAVEYQREANPNTRWEFVGVLSVQEVLDESLQEGAELFTRFLTAKEARKLLRTYRRAIPLKR